MFESVEKSIELYKRGVEPNTDFWYVWNCEETEMSDFNIKGDTEAQLASLKEDDADIDVDNGRNIFDEFTANICPAYKEGTK